MRKLKKKENVTWTRKKRLKAFMKKIEEYDDKRDLPAESGTSELSVYLRFGNLSIRECARALGDIKKQGKKDLA